MGGQACVLYGAAQFSRDIDFLILAEDTNFSGLEKALSELQAERIAIPRFHPEFLLRGHAVHFRCKAEGVEGLRIDVMTTLRNFPPFHAVWERRTTILHEDNMEIQLLSVPDLIQAKKTQRDKDWPMIAALVEAHYQVFHHEPTSERVSFWLKESRTPERLFELVAHFPKELSQSIRHRPLLSFAQSGDAAALRGALDAEVRAEQEIDRLYWNPLKREMEMFRREERGL